MSKTYCYHIVFLKFFKNDCILVNSSTHYAFARETESRVKKYVFPTRSLHTYLWSLSYSSPVTDMFKNISVELWTDVSLGKSTTGMMLLSLIGVHDNVTQLKRYEQVAELCYECAGDADLHIPSQATCTHFSLWAEEPG